VNFLFQYLKGYCHGNQFCGKICAKITYPPALIALSFLNGMVYRYLNVRINGTKDASIWYENFGKFGLVTYATLVSLFVNVRYDTAKKLAHLV